MKLSELNEYTFFKIVNLNLPKSIIDRFHSLNFNKESVFFINKIYYQKYIELILIDKDYFENVKNNDEDKVDRINKFIKNNIVQTKPKIILGYSYLDKIEVSLIEIEPK